MSRMKCSWICQGELSFGVSGLNWSLNPSPTRITSLAPKVGGEQVIAFSFPLSGSPHLNHSRVKVNLGGKCSSRDWSRL